MVNRYDGPKSIHGARGSLRNSSDFFINIPTSSTPIKYKFLPKKHLSKFDKKPLAEGLLPMSLLLNSMANATFYNFETKSFATCVNGVVFQNS